MENKDKIIYLFVFILILFSLFGIYSSWSRALIIVSSCDAPLWYDCAGVVPIFSVVVLIISIVVLICSITYGLTEIVKKK